MTMGVSGGELCQHNTYLMTKNEVAQNIVPSPKWLRQIITRTTTLLIIMPWAQRQNEAFESQGKPHEWKGNQYEQLDIRAKHLLRQNDGKQCGWCLRQGK